MNPRTGAMALALLATPAVFAQSGVKISGFLDIGVYRDAAKTWNVGTIQRSNIAFSGSEDLGGGMAATFKLSHRMELDTGAGEGVPNKPFWHGESTVGLKGPFGAVKFGRALDALSNNDYAFDPWEYFNRIASPAWDLWHYNYAVDPQGNNGRPEFGRLNNGVFYDSPSFGGFAVHLSGSPEKRPGDTRRPLTASLTYDHARGAAMIAHGKNSAGDTDTFLGLKGKFGAFAVMGAYDVSKSGASTAKAKTLGVQYTAGLTTVNGGWGRVDVDGAKAQDMVSVGAAYMLSKRTSVYADVARKRFPASSSTVFGAGIAHSF